MSDRKKLEAANNAYKHAIEREIKEVKRGVNKVGRNAVIGGLLVLSVVALNSLWIDDSDKPGKKKKKQKKVKAKQAGGILLDSIKEELILTSLGFAARKLSEFINDLDNAKGEEHKG